MLAPFLSHADVGPPAHLRITEREPGLFVLQWQVPKALPPRAVPIPALPETCEPAGKRSVDERSAAWLFTQDWRCETTLAGQPVHMRYPFSDLALTTVVRVDFLSGDRFTHVLTPGDGAWLLPEGTAVPNTLGVARRAVVSGILHVLGSWTHLAFLLVAGLLGQFRQVIRVVSALTLGQLVGVLATSAVPGIGVAPAEIALAVMVAVLARELLRPESERRRLFALPALAGFVHGLAVGGMLTQAVGEQGGGAKILDQ